MHSRIRSFAAALVCVVAACAQPSVRARLAYMETRIDGELALDGDTSSGDAPDEQDVGSAFGLGSARASPYLAVAADFGAPVVSASVFWLHENGRGRLGDPFGGLPAGTAVDSDLELAVAKLTAAYAFAVGPVTFAPGLLADVYVLEFSATEALLGNREEIDDAVLVPMPFLRVATGLGDFGCEAELGFLELPDLDGARARFLDAEISVAWRPSPLVEIFAGYRHLEVDATGDTSSQSFASDLRVNGWLAGGALRF